MSIAGSNNSVDDEENANISNLNPPLNNTTSSNATNTSLTSQGLDNTASNHSFNTVFPTVHDSLFKKNKPFFSEDFITQLEIWKKILINTSRYCTKLNFSGTDFEKNLEIDFPVFRAKVDDVDAFMSFDTIHPVLVRGKREQHLVSVAYLSILELWPLLVLCFSCAALSGMIVWLLDCRSNPEQFPKRFWRGIFDGMWWAVVTMTTVGYGDKSPKSNVARLFATVWMISGIILLSMFTAQVSSRLTTQELQSDNHLFGKKIGVPPALYYDDSDYADYRMTYSFVEALKYPIKTTKALSDNDLSSVVVFHCEDKRDKNSWEVLQFMLPCEVGAEIYPFHYDSQSSDHVLMEIDADQNYIKCMKMQTAMTRRYRSKNKKKKLQSSCNKLLEEHDKLKFQFKWVYFKSLSEYLIPLGTVTGTLLLVFILGAIWDCCRRRRGNSSKRPDSEAVPLSFMRQGSTKEEEAMLSQNSTKC